MQRMVMANRDLVLLKIILKISFAAPKEKAQEKLTMMGCSTWNAPHLPASSGD
jgi:hypothetical protein